MANTIFLKHLYPSNIPLRTQYFYDGRAVVRYGTIELPVDRPAWLDRAFILGFRCDPDTGRAMELTEIRALAEAELNATSTESAGEVDEGLDAGGQPGGADGVRPRKQSRSKSVSKAGLDSGVGDGATVEAEGD